MKIQKNNHFGSSAAALTLIALILCLSVGIAAAFSSGPPNGRTDAPGEGNCTGCHSTFPLNSGSGTLAVSGVGASYNADQDYDLLVSLDDPDASRWGFEFTVIGDDGESPFRIIKPLGAAPIPV